MNAEGTLSNNNLSHVRCRRLHVRYVSIGQITNRIRGNPLALPEFPRRPLPYMCSDMLMSLVNACGSPLSPRPLIDWMKSLPVPEISWEAQWKVICCRCFQHAAKLHAPQALKPKRQPGMPQSRKTCRVVISSGLRLAIEERHRLQVIQMYDEFLCSLADKHMQVPEVALGPLARKQITDNQETKCVTERVDVAVSFNEFVQAASGARHSAVEFFSAMVRAPEH